MTSRAEEYRRYARQCLEIAPTFQDEEARRIIQAPDPPGDARDGPGLVICAGLVGRRK